MNKLNAKNFKTKKVTDMSGMFGGCSNLIDLDVSNFNTENVSVSEKMFYNCGNNIKEKIKKLVNFKRFDNIY